MTQRKKHWTCWMKNTTAWINDSSTQLSCKLLLTKWLRDWWQIFNTNLKQANENKIAMDNMKNDIRELDKKITELLVKKDL